MRKVTLLYCAKMYGARYTLGKRSRWTIMYDGISENATRSACLGLSISYSTQFWNIRYSK